MRRHLMKAAGKKLPAWFKEHIVCWYSPKRQGCTNESLAADPTLADLSGNGMDLELVGFKYTEASGINTDGALRFNGDCYGKTVRFDSPASFTYIAKRQFVITNSEGNVFCSQSSASWHGWTGEVANNNGTRECFLGGSSYIDIAPYFNSGLDVSWLTPTKYKGNTIIDAVKYATNKAPLTIGTIRVNDSIDRKFRGVLYDFFYFDTELTEEQVEWVKENLTTE